MEFIDINGYKVILTIEEPIHHHVLIIPKYNEQYILTHHKTRGIEFPGGKVEANETSVDGAKRELYEETGARVKHIQYIATYEVLGEIPFKKDVFVVDVAGITKKDNYLETHGPVLVRHIDEVTDNASPLLKDACIRYIFKEVYGCGKGRGL